MRDLQEKIAQYKTEKNAVEGRRKRWEQHKQRVLDYLKPLASDIGLAVESNFEPHADLAANRNLILVKQPMLNLGITHVIEETEHALVLGSGVLAIKQQWNGKIAAYMASPFLQVAQKQLTKPETKLLAQLDPEQLTEERLEEWLAEFMELLIEYFDDGGYDYPVEDTSAPIGFRSNFDD